MIHPARSEPREDMLQLAKKTGAAVGPTGGERKVGRLNDFEKLGGRISRRKKKKKKMSPNSDSYSMHSAIGARPNISQF